MNLKETQFDNSIYLKNKYHYYVGDYNAYIGIENSNNIT